MTELNIVVDWDDGSITLGNNEIGLLEIPAFDGESIAWMKKFSTLLETKGIKVSYQEIT